MVMQGRAPDNSAIQPVETTGPVCPSCLKPLGPVKLCLCDQLKPLATRLHVLILQHPQEPDKELGSARLAHLALPNSTLRVGLSWPNLSKALGRETIPSEWGVLYLGGKPTKGNARDKAPRLQIATKTGNLLDVTDVKLTGIVVLDGTWSQAKTLWWRNPWLLKLKRLVLTPARPSLYGNLRREPRRECLSTIESIAEALEGLGESPEVGQALRLHFSELLRRWRRLALSQMPGVSILER